MIEINLMTAQDHELRKAFGDRVRSALVLLGEIQDRHTADTRDLTAFFRVKLSLNQAMDRFDEWLERRTNERTQDERATA